MSANASPDSPQPPTPAATPKTSSWLTRAARRPLQFFWLKAIATPAIMGGFFIGYFALLNHPRITPTTIPRVAADSWIGFHPLALIPYASLWLYVMLPSSQIVRLRELLIHAAGTIALSVAGLACFYFWPTTTPPADIDWAHYPQMAFLKKMDEAGNACPSLHVAFAVFAACWLTRMLRRVGASRTAHALNILWAIAIVYSTLATRQHVALDVLAGAALGAVVVWINLRLSPDTREHVSGDASIH